MKNYRTISKITLAICLCGIIFAVINQCTGVINESVSMSGTIISIVGFVVAGTVTIFLEKDRAKKQNDK